MCWGYDVYRANGASNDFARFCELHTTQFSVQN